MTKLLEKAFNQASKLADASQDAIAAIVLEELEDEKKWETSFANSQESLSKLATKVRNEIKQGETLPFDPASKKK
ncbi:MAG: hypothetical protein HON76_01100 [Candidatus Scalindua sp.]|jgi:hypothetical protein|nr:hypothetical protein [Candidatus Scalindua sp.]MBT5304945.1 hypothetical protein [Candidatus Scalindua sp.]MBT6052541.1 hypothetical protein [Candidatus Scalindua sp.]MBT6561110.1 hypothetical protein [Candidatus Scalindua sp.]MBT7209827.1 hypothetical protein [Candidatus Scalindua sp.]